MHLALGHLFFSSFCYLLLDGDQLRVADEDGDLTLEEFHWGAVGLEDHQRIFGRFVDSFATDTAKADKPHTVQKAVLLFLLICG